MPLSLKPVFDQLVCQNSLTGRDIYPTRSVIKSFITRNDKIFGESKGTNMLGVYSTNQVHINQKENNEVRYDAMNNVPQRKYQSLCTNCNKIKVTIHIAYVFTIQIRRLGIKTNYATK